jgi:hypothetical protein
MGPKIRSVGRRKKTTFKFSRLFIALDPIFENNDFFVTPAHFVPNCTVASFCHGVVFYTAAGPGFVTPKENSCKLKELESVRAKSVKK